MTKLELVPATTAALTAFWGERPKRSLRAWAALLDAEPVGVGGFAYGGPYITVFSDLKPEIRPYRKQLWGFAKTIMAEAKRYGAPLMAIADPDEITAPRFLERLGFQFVSTTSDGDVYQWQP